MVEMSDIQLYWVMMATGALGVFICLWLRRRRFNLSVWKCLSFSILAVGVAYLGAKILYVLENLQNTLEYGISFGGLSLFGSVFAIPLLMPLVGRLFGLCPGQSLDICGPCAAVMLGFVRIGCFFSGCCGGLEFRTESFCFRWPTQATESIGAFAILGLLLQKEEESESDGMLYPVFLICYGVMRFLVEFFRDTPKDWLYFSHGQWFALAAILIGILWIRRRKEKGYAR